MGDRDERKAAWDLSQLLDEWLTSGGGAKVAAPEESQALLKTAQRLAQLPALLPPPRPAIVQRVLSTRRPASYYSPRRNGWLRWRPAFAAGFAVIVCLVVALILPPSRAVLAEWMARISLGRLAVVVTPEQQPALPVQAVEQRLADMDEARAVMPFSPLVVTRVPAGYALRSLTAVTFQGMPEWVPQPFYLEANYGPEGEDVRDYYLTVRQFAVSFGPNREVNRLGFHPQEVVRLEEVKVGEEPAVLVELGMTRSPLRELIWQHEGLAIEFTSRVLSADELVSIAESMR
ncbi:MAG: hypothetical protein IT330_09510 [Anaerolineae bacterium]|nr:hypothetical protein [Anaerolineae bacterium]